MCIRIKETRKERPLWNEIARLDTIIKTNLGIWEQLRVIEEVLFRKVHDPVLGNLFQLGLPKTLQSEVFKSLHSDVISAHLDVNRTIDILYWPNMREDISNGVENVCYVNVEKTKKAKVSNATVLGWSTHGADCS